jgi:hypothetical protein
METDEVTGSRACVRFLVLAPCLLDRHTESELADSNTKSCVFLFPLCVLISVWQSGWPLGFQHYRSACRTFSVVWWGTDIFISLSLMADSPLSLFKTGADFPARSIVLLGSPLVIICSYSNVRLLPKLFFRNVWLLFVRFCPWGIHSSARRQK